MIEIKRFIFNNFQTNTYLICDGQKKCVIIDPACSGSKEENMLSSFIESQKLEVEKVFLTHCHVDHLLGVKFVEEKYGKSPYLHKQGFSFYENSPEFAFVFGLNLGALPEKVCFYEDGEKMKIGDMEFSIAYTPGHVDGSVCIICHQNETVFSGDVLFRESIGRTDLPTGDYETLMLSIKSKLFTLPGSYTVLPGHGPETSIGFEILNNPFID